MVDEEKISPEEKLLKAVEEGNKHKEQQQASLKALEDAARAAGEKKSAPGKPVPPWSVKTVDAVEWFKKIQQNLELKIQELQERKLLPSFSFFSGWRLDLALINRLIAIAAVLLGLYMIVDFLLFRPEIPLEIRPGGPAALTDVLFETAQSRKLAEYEKLADNRNIFKPYAPKPVVTVSEAESAAQAAGGTVNFKVVAIASTGTGFEAIVEDQNLKQTYFLKKGDMIQDYHVESIQWDTLTLKKGNQKWDIH